MTIDEAIKLVKIERECVIRADHCDRKCEKCDLVQDANIIIDMYEHVEIWLEELKALRHEANEWRRAGYKHGHSDGYNKAIDEAMITSANAICVGCGYLDGTECKYKGGNCGVSKPMLETVMKALEQLKAGGKNEMDN